MEEKLLNPLLQKDIDNNQKTKKVEKHKQPREIQEATKVINNLKYLKSNLVEILNESNTLNGHSESIFSVGFSPDGKLLASGSRDKSIKVWNISEKHEEFTLYGHSSSILSVCFSIGGKLLASGSGDKTIKIWNISERHEEFNLTGHSHDVNSVCFSPDGKLLASGSDDKTIKVWNIGEKCEEFTLNGHSGGVNSVYFSSDGKLLASGSSDKSIKVWNVSEKREEFTLNGHYNYVNSVCFSTDGQLLASGSRDKSIKVWSINEKREEFTLNGHSSPVKSVCFSPDGKLLATGSLDKSIKIWNVSEKREEFTLNGHFSSVESVCFRPDGKLLASGSENIKVWNFSEKGEVFNLNGHSSSVKSVCLSPDGKLIASGSVDNRIKVWNVSEKHEEFTLNGHYSPVESVCFSPDGKSLATGSENIKIWNLSEKREEFTFDGHSSSVESVCFSPEGKFLASGSRDSRIKVWNINEKCEEFALNGHSGGVESVCFSPDSKLLASGSRDKSIKVWNISEKREELTLNGHYYAVKSVCFSPDGKLLASGSRDKSIKVWNVSEQREEFTLNGHSDWVESVCFSPDGKFIASGSDDKTIKVWNVSEKREELTLNGPSPIKSICFRPDKKLLVSGSSDNSIKVWDLSIGDSKFESNRFLPNESIIKFSSDNFLELTNKGSNTTQLFDDRAISNSPQKNFCESNSLLLYSFILETQKYQGLLRLLNALYMISQDQWDSINQWDILITNLNFTPLHLAALSGQSAAIKKALESTNSFRILADGFGYSPLHYSILKKHQKVTDSILQYIVQNLKDEKIFIPKKFSIMHSIRNDLSLIIQNSPIALCEFLNECLYCIDSEPTYGKVKANFLFVNSATRSFSDFLEPHEEIRDKEPLMITVSWFPLPATIGSKESIELLKELVNAKEKNIFKAHFIRAIIQIKWNQLKSFIYGYSALLLINLVLIVLLLSDFDSNKFWIAAILFTSINTLLLIWEVFQIAATGINYVKDPWNWIDLTKILLSLYWPLLIYYKLNIKLINWVLVLLSVVCGLTSFRAFDSTRYYIKLIAESLKDVTFFLVIFVYATLSYGLLNFAIKDQAEDDSIGEYISQVLWINSFGIAFGPAKSDFNEVDLGYLSYLLAVTLNVVLMLNMIISIFGDSFDKFQLLSNYYKYKEMAQVILEVERIFSFLDRPKEFKFVHMIENPYTGDDLWKGKFVENKELIEKTNNEIKAVKDDVKAHIGAVKNDVNTVKDDIKIVRDDVKADIKAVKHDINSVRDHVKADIKAVEDKITSIEEKLKAIIEFLQPK
jgi:WD40 repeat protein/gas vesicle protein